MKCGGNEIDILKELATLDPLDDRAFRIYISDDDEFAFLAKSLSGESLDGETIIHMNGEIVLTANGRLIRTDALRSTISTFFNIEGQIKTEDFPLTRHIFYTAVIYANGIQKGDAWNQLKPVISIVIYKDKGEADLFEKATLEGSLIKTDADRKHLTLIAVNTAKWKMAPSEELRAYLSTLHHGIMTEDNKSDFTSVDTNSNAFIRIQRAVRMACAHTKKQEYDEKGDDSMSAVYATYLSKEEREAAVNEGEARGEARGEASGEARGRKQAFDVILEIINLLKSNVPVPEIASKYKISTQEIEKLRGVL